MNSTAILPHSGVRELTLSRIARGLFDGPIRVDRTGERVDAARRAGENMHARPQTNPHEKPIWMQVRHTTESMIVEEAFRSVNGISRPWIDGVDIRDHADYAWDAVVDGLRVEVKSVPPSVIRWDHISYKEDSMKTLEKHRDDVDAVVFGAAMNYDTAEVAGYWDVEFTWVVDPMMFLSYGRTESDGYFKFRPFRNERLRRPDVVLYNRRYVDDE